MVVPGDVMVNAQDILLLETGKLTLTVLITAGEQEWGF